METELRLRSKLADSVMPERQGKMMRAEDIDVMVKGPTKMLKPDGKPLLIYIPGAYSTETLDVAYPELHKIRAVTRNRGAASGTQAMKLGRHQTRAMPVTSSIIGSFDATSAPYSQYCRLTAFTAREIMKENQGAWGTIRPVFQEAAKWFEEKVPDRYAEQVKWCRKTHQEWVIPGTPFTTITVNNTYPTGIHTDKGDLAEGFSCLGVLRRGEFEGGWLTFPQYRVAIDMQDGDLLLMDAHEWHGNTPLTCMRCGELLKQYGHECPEPAEHKVIPERISIVHYYRTGLAKCGTFEEEQAKGIQKAEARTQKGMEDPEPDPETYPAVE